MIPAPTRDLTRRGLVVAGLASLAGCAEQSTDARPAPAAPTTAPASTLAPIPRPAPALTPSPTPTVGWRPGPQEISPEIKLAAVRSVERDGVAEGWSTEVRYAQYGGLLADSACVLVLAAQTSATPVSAGATRTRDLVVDVRLRRAGDGWQVTSSRGHAGRRAGVGTTSTAAVVLADPRLHLPAAARADVARGRVQQPVLELLVSLAREHRLSVSVLRAGHPREVFGTTSVSNHTRGRAVDVWAIDDRPVVDMALDDPLLLAVLAGARARGSDEVGGPVDLDGAGGVHFANALHRDHVHLGFDP